jgi:hypothetical protein
MRKGKARQDKAGETNTRHHKSRQGKQTLFRKTWKFAIAIFMKQACPYSILHNVLLRHARLSEICGHNVLLKVSSTMKWNTLIEDPNKTRHDTPRYDTTRHYTTRPRQDYSRPYKRRQDRTGRQDNTTQHNRRQ